MAIDNDLNHLKDPFRKKAKCFLEIIKTKYPNVAPFETLRSRSRQALLFATRKSWTMNSKHLTGEAVDRVFMDGKNPTWKGDYYFLQRIATMCGMKRIKQELCHTQDNGISIADQLKNNSKRYNETTDKGEQYWLHLVNEKLRKVV